MALRHSTLRPILASACLVLIFPIEARAQVNGSDASAARIERLIAELDDEQFATREAAVAALKKIGKAAEAAVKSAAERSPSLEVRARASDILQAWKMRRHPVAGRVLSGHAAFVNMVAFSPDGEMLASAGEDGLAVLWQWKTGGTRATLRGHAGGLLFIAYSPDGKILATCGRDAKVMLWDAATGRNVATISDHTAAVSAVAYSPDGETLATAGDDHVVKLRDKNGKLRHVLEGPKQQTAALAFSRDGKLLVSGGGVFNTPARFGELMAWDLDSKKNRWTAAEDLGAVWGLSVSPGGKQLAGVCLDNTVRLWELETGKPQRVLRGHTGYVIGVAYAPDGQTLATSSYDGTVRIWDADSGEELHVVRGHANQAVQRLAYAPDSRTLATCGNDQQVRVWQIPE